MSLNGIKTITDVKVFLLTSEIVKYQKYSKKEALSTIRRTLKRFKYKTLSKLNKGIIRKYLIYLTGYSRAQITRNIALALNLKQNMPKQKKNSFQKKYTQKDIELLAKTDESHDYVNGNALKKILETEYKVYGNEEFKNISKISVSHIYNLRFTKMYRQIAKTYEPTKPSINIEIGIRTKPYPNGIPGYLRLDSVSQGNKDDEKGLFHINIVDEVTQFEFVISVPQISEKYMIKALEQIIQMFPFKILGFHSDNGKEYINRKVCALLNRLNIRQTKSRARRSNDNALVESKNGAIIRKHIGYTFIGQKYANLVNKYYMEYLNVYLNFSDRVVLRQR